MATHITGPILLVCADADRSFAILGRLYEEGFSTVGPAPSAGAALTLTARTMVGTAIIAGQLNGRRSASELADELGRIWGVECFVLGEIEPEACEARRDPSGGERMTVLRRTLRTDNLHRAVH